MTRRNIPWHRLVFALVLIGQGTLVNYGAGVPLISAQAPPNTLNTIVQKEDQILGAIKALPPPPPSPDLSGVTQSWNKALPAAQRFEVLAAFNNQAVLDKETGLVWEKSPSTTASDWGIARVTCLDKNVGGRKGWRLPAVADLMSLVDPSVPVPGPALPPGHPFLTAQGTFYWTGSTNSNTNAEAWEVLLHHGTAGFTLKTGSALAWCVRGGMNSDPY